MALSSGATLTKDIYEKVKSRLNIPLLHIYGCTEIGSVSIPTPDDLFPSVGKPTKNVSVRITDENGADLEHSEIGYIYVKGSNLVHQIWQDNGFITVDCDEYEIGDQGMLTDHGDLIVVGRNKHRIKVNGLSLHLSEVEDVLLQHKNIIGAVVVSKSDENRGNLLIAYIQPVDKPPGEVELRIYCQAHLAPYKIPHRFIFVDKFEKDEKGQLNRKLFE